MTDADLDDTAGEDVQPSEGDDDRRRKLPRWVIPSIVLFWVGYLATLAVRDLWHDLSGIALLLLVSLFLALAIEPGVNRLVARGWRRGRATALILLGVIAFFVLFVAAIGTLVGTQVAELLENSEDYITDTVDVINDTFNTSIDAQQVIDDFNDPNGPVQEFIDSQQDKAIDLSVAALGVMLQLLSALLFTYYLVADGPKLRRVLLSRLTPRRQAHLLRAWELAINKTGGYLYSRALLAIVSALFHWVVFQSLEIAAPVPLALWVGIISQFLPVVGTYLAGVLPVLITFLDSPLKAAIVVALIVLYQQVENYLLSPRITARTMELHPAVAFGSALAGVAVLGPIGAILALPGAAMVQALLGEWGSRHDVVDSPLTTVEASRLGRTGQFRPTRPRRWRRRRE